jgi:DHA1 family multidrug resistance protein-like MFS transporter
MAPRRLEEMVQRLAALPAWYRDNRVLAWVCVVIAVNQLGFGSIVPVVPLYAKSFGVSQFLIGLTVAVYGLARFAANMPAGRISDLLGRGWAIAIGGVITAGGNLLCGFAGSYGLFLTGRFIGGLGAALVLTGTQIILTDISTPENRGRIIALYMTVFMFAVGIAPLPGGYLAENFGLDVPFFVYAVLGLAVTALALARVPETRVSGPIDGRTSGGGPQFGGQILELMREPAFLLVSVASFATFFARTGGVFTILPQRAEDSMGLTTGQIGLGLSAISIISLAVAFPSGVVIDRFGRKAVIVPALLFGSVAMILFTISGDFVFYVVSCLVWGVSVGLAGAAPTAYAADVAPPGMNAAAMGTFRTLSDSGYVFGPFLLGAIAGFSGTGAALVVTAVMLLVIGVGFALVAPEPHEMKRPVGAAKDAPAD